MLEKLMSDRGNDDDDDDDDDDSNITATVAMK